MPLGATHIGKGGGAEAATDRELPPADIVVLSFADSDLSALPAAWKSDAGILPTLRLASLKKLQHPMSADLYVERVVAHARALIVRPLGRFEYWRSAREVIASVARKYTVMVRAMPGADRP